MFRRLSEEKRSSRELAVRLLEDLAAALATKGPIGPDATDAVVARLEAMTTVQQTGGAGRNADTVALVTVLDHPHLRDHALVPFEMMVNEEMNADPDSVPDGTRTRFEALWRYDQAGEYGTMGGVVHKGFIYSRARDPVFLLELPSSDLVGWMFGEAGSLGVFLAPEDLESGRWHSAWGDILNQTVSHRRSKRDRTGRSPRSCRRSAAAASRRRPQERRTPA